MTTEPFDCLSRRMMAIVRPAKTAETMPAGWSWRIDHREHVNRGYVYSSAFTSDDEAERVLRGARGKRSQRSEPKGEVRDRYHQRRRQPRYGGSRRP